MSLPFGRYYSTKRGFCQSLSKKLSADVKKGKHRHILFFCFGLITDLADRIYRYKSFWVGLFDEFHKLAVFVLINDRYNFFSQDVVVRPRAFIERRAAVKLVQNVVNYNVKLRGENANLSFDVESEDKMVDNNSAEIRSEKAEDIPNSEPISINPIIKSITFMIRLSTETGRGMKLFNIIANAPALPIATFDGSIKKNSAAAATREPKVITAKSLIL